MKHSATGLTLALAAFVAIAQAPAAWASPASSCTADFSSCDIFEGGSIVSLPGLAISGDVVVLGAGNDVSDVFRIFNDFADTGGGTGLGTTAFLYSDDEGNLPDPSTYSANVVMIHEGPLIAPGLTETDFNGNGTLYRLFSDEPVQGVPEPGAWVVLLVGFVGVGAMARRQRPSQG